MLAYDYPLDLGGSPSAGRYSIAIGSGSVTPTATDTALTTEIFRKAVAVRYVVSSYTSRMMTTFLATEPPGTSNAFYEFGLFTESPITGVTNSSFESWSAGSPVGWDKTGGSWVASGSNVYDGTASAELSGSALFSQHLYPFNSFWQGRNITFRCTVQEATKTGHQTKLFLSDGVGTTLGNAHTGGSACQLLSVTRTIDSDATDLEFGIQIEQGTSWVDWANVNVDGEMLAHTLATVAKTNLQPMNVTWDIYMDTIA
jgi:hypothetical protein